MKKKIKKRLTFVILSILILFTFIITSFAAEIGGEYYNLKYTSVQTPINQYSSAYKIYINFSSDVISTNVDYDNYYCKNIVRTIFNSLNIEFEESYFNNDTFKTFERKFITGEYFAGDVIGPVLERIYIQKFLQELNHIITTLMVLDLNNMTGIGTHGDVYDYKVAYVLNNNLTNMFLINLNGFLEDLQNTQIIKITQINNLINNSVFSLQTDYNIEIDNNKLIYCGFRYDNKSTIITSPITDRFSISNVIKLAKNVNTWNFLPNNIINLLVSFITFITATAVTIGVLKKVG